MIKIVNTSTLQRNLGQVMRDAQRKPHIVISKSQAKMILLPYFEGCDDFIEDYFRELKRPELKECYRQSVKSGLSDLSL